MTGLERAVGVEREAPEGLLRALRVIDPTAELIYLGDGNWMLGRIRPSEPLRQAGARLARSCRLATKHRSTLLPTDYRRHLVAQLRMLGFQPTTEYHVQGEPTAAIVRDQEVMDFLWRTTSDDALSQMDDAGLVAKQAAARAEMLDEGRAADAWRYLFTRSHAITRVDDPTRDRVASGRTRHFLRSA